MKLKGIKSLTILFMVALVLNTCAFAAVRRVSVVDWDRQFTFTAEDVNVWLADDEGIWRSYKRTTPKFIVELSGVTALDAYDGGVYALRKDGRDYIVSFIEPENGVTQEWLLPDLGGYCGIVALQDKIALLAGKTDECTLVFLDKANGTVQEVEGAENLAYISRRSETSVFAGSLTEGKIISVVTDGAIEDIYQGGFYAQSVYEKEDRTLLLFGQSEGSYMISRMKPGEEPEELSVIDIPGLIYGGKIAKDRLYVDANHTLYQIDIAELETIADNAPSQVLTVGAIDDSRTWGWPFPTAAARRFEAEHPGVKVQIVRASQEDMALMLMADASKYDLLYLKQFDADSILRADIVEDLSAYPELMEQKENWIDIGAMYDAQGRWLRIPVDMESPYLLLPVSNDRGIYKEIGIEWKNGVTYERFIELCESACAEDMHLMGTLDSFNNQFWLYTSMHGNSVEAGVMHFDTPEFRQLMEFWKYLYTERLVPITDGAEPADADKFYLDEDEFPFTDVRPRQFSAILNGTYLYPPTPDGEKIAPITVGAGLYLNRYGVQKDLAVDFLAAYMSPEVQSELIADYDMEKSIMFLKDYTLYENLEDNVYYYMYNFSPESYANWVEVLENTRYHGHLFAEMRSQYQVMVLEYMAGELELEGFVAEMEKLADIWMNE